MLLKFGNLNLKLIIVITAILITGVFAVLFLPVHDLRVPEISRNQPRTVNSTELYTQVVPAEGVTFHGTWQNIGPRLVASGAIDLEKFEYLYASSGRSLTEEQIAFFTRGSNETIRITPKNADFILNILWALGLVNKNNIFDEGPMSQYIAKGRAGVFASTDGWLLGAKSGEELLNSADIINLTPAQQVVVEKIAMNSYRPCCNNPAGFPDCNHGAAALGLVELLASQGATEEQVAAAIKAANSMWFPQQYLELAIYFNATKGIDWNDVDPEMVIGKNYSSISGWLHIHNELKEMGLLPETKGGGGSCGI